MRLQIISPPSFRNAERFHDKPDYTRLALASLAAVARTRAPDLRCSLLDCKHEGLDLAAAMQRVRDFAPQVIGLTAFTNEVKQAAQVAHSVREWNPKAVVVLGGVHVTALSVRTMQEFPCFDYAVAGEGEETLVEFLAGLERGEMTALAAIQGLIWRDGENIRVNAARPPNLNLDAWPMPAWDLFPPSREYLIMTERGCPFQCVFCMNPNGRRVRQRSAARVMEELSFLAERPGCERFIFCDEVFGADKKETLALLDAMIDSGIGRRVRSFAQTHVSFVDDALLRKMKRAGFYGIGFGVETGDLQWMPQLGKGLRPDRVFFAREATRRAGLQFVGYFILGQPNETWRSALRTIQFAIQLNVDLPVFGLMVPYPGTEVARMAERGECGFKLKSRDWNDYNKQLGNALELEHLTRAQMELLQALGYVGVFAANRRWRDLARFAWRFRSEGAALASRLVHRAIGRV